MSRLLVLAGFAFVAISLSGCVIFDPSDSGSPAPATPKIDRARQYAQDVKVFEGGAGTDHDFTPEEIHEMMETMRREPVFKNKFMGVSTLQNPTDLWIIMEIMYETKPDLIVETGTFHGGSAPFWAIILEHINPDGRVITIDIKDQRDKRAISWPISQRNVDFLLGSSTDPAIVADVHRRAKGKRVLVILDSLHSKGHVANELKAYAPLVSVGGYIIVQDTMNAFAAIDEFLAASDSFIADRSRERYSDTNTIRGYLKRVKP